MNSVSAYLSYDYRQEIKKEIGLIGRVSKRCLADPSPSWRPFGSILMRGSDAPTRKMSTASPTRQPLAPRSDCVVAPFSCKASISAAISRGMRGAIAPFHVLFCKLNGVNLCELFGVRGSRLGAGFVLACVLACEVVKAYVSSNEPLASLLI